MEVYIIISAIIPTYKNPKYLDLCLKSAILGQSQKNEIIVVVDGFVEESKDILEKWKTQIKIVVFGKNMGMQTAINHGVWSANNEKILIVNEDNVFPKKWDEHLENVYTKDIVITPNQIEPFKSIFNSFVEKDFGNSIDDFEFEAFLNYEEKLHQECKLQTSDGKTFPVFMNKKWFMIIGGLDSLYPSPYVCDWDFFVKLELLGISCVRDYSL